VGELFGFSGSFDFAEGETSLALLPTGVGDAPGLGGGVDVDLSTALGTTLGVADTAGVETGVVAGDAARRD